MSTTVKFCCEQSETVETFGWGKVKENGKDSNNKRVWFVSV